VLDCVGQFNWGQLPAGDQVAVTLFATVAEPWPASVSARHCEGRAERCEDAAGVTLERAALEDLPAGLGLFGPGTFVTTTLTRTGFFELDAQGYDSHLHHPLITPVDRAPLVFAPLVAPELWAAGFAAFGVEDDPAYGLLNIDTYDCLLDRAPELSFSVSPPPTNSDSVSYFDQPPTPGLDRTVQSGTGGVALVDPGLLDVRAVHAETREVIAREHVWARAGARTYLHLVPRSSSDPP
jgi:hypothetical protein